MDLYLLSFNNYYNRQVKKFDTFAEYEPYVLHVVDNYNFVPGDGVNTILKAINYDGETQPDYALVVDGITIKSRWFIIDGDFIRKGQYKYTLHRDVIADSYNDILNSPCFIEKATVAQNDPAIFNKEDMTFNQIKSGEAPLMDKSKTSWIVGYIPSDAFPEDRVINTTFIDPGHPDIEVADIKNWEYFKYSTLAGEQRTDFINIDNFKCLMEFNIDWHYKSTLNGTTEDTSCKAIVESTLSGNLLNNSNAWGRCEVVYKNNDYGIGFDLDRSLAGTLNLSFPNCGVRLQQQSPYAESFFLNTYLRDVQNRLELSSLRSVISNELKKQGADVGENFPVSNLQGARIFDKATNTVYSINVVKTTMLASSSFDRYEFTESNKALGRLYPTKLSYKNPLGNNLIPEVKNVGFDMIKGTITGEGEIYKIELTQLTTNINATISNSKARYHLYDAPYDMFCMPYNDNYIMKDGSLTVENRRYAALSMAISIGAATGTDNVYDVQLLPYCPIQNAINPDGSLNLLNRKYNLIKGESGTNYGAIIWCDKSNFTFDIPYEIKVEDKKISNECDTYRLCSPNYASMFEFSPAKNDGVSKFNVDATYKPFNPYIHLNPDFKGLYGADYNDARGLILSGDFSLTQLSKEWANYELRNKNYQTSFDRRIENMEINNKYQKTNEIINAVAGSAQGGVSGAIMGSLAGPIGTVVGGVLGAGLSAGAGAADTMINDKLRAEALDYTKDQFGYQLGNIQAIPYAITKSTALTANNKLFPFLEYYTCSETEKQALRDKIKYNGMTVMRIGTIAYFKKATPTYIKGKIIRLNNLQDDFHYVSSVADEVNKGIFI